MDLITITLLICSAGALLLYTVGIGSVVKHQSRRVVETADAQLPPISLLKPLKGTEEALEANLVSFFEQRYPAPFELVFAAESVTDEGYRLAREVSLRYPDVATRFVISDMGFGLNPKVSNLAAAYRAAEYDLVLQSDANVRVAPDYVRRIVQELHEHRAGLLTSMVVGVGERSLGATMENLQLGAFIAPAMCTALHVAGVSCVVGKSMLFRRSELNALGGLEAVRDILCEDFVLGQLYQQAGHGVVLSSVPVENVNHELSVKQFLARHSRWLKMRAVIHIPAFVADFFANPVSLAVLALVASGFSAKVALILAGIIAYKLLGDAYLLRLTRGHAMPLSRLWVAPIKDTLMGMVWFYSIFSRSVTWRGRRLRFGKMSRLRPDDGSLPVRLVRWMFGTIR